MVEPIIEVKNLTFKYDQRVETETLSDISFTIKRGDWVAIVGKNGSGKSTLAKLLVGLLEPQQGTITISGIGINEANIRKIRRKIGMVFQNPDNQFIGTTVEDDIAFGLENFNMPFDEMKQRVDMALRITGLTDLRLLDPSRLSGGQKQRVSLAGVLALRPSVIVLDEAFVMLDPKSREELLATLSDIKTTENISILSITHDMNEAAAADQVILLESGRIRKMGTPKDVFQYDIEGMEPPISEQLRRILKQRGYHLPEYYMNENEMVQWIWKSN